MSDKRERLAPIATISSARQVHVIDVFGRDRPQTAGGDPALMWGSWTPGGSVAAAHSWPTWSPDGTKIACFSISEDSGPGGDGDAHVLILNVDGVESLAVSDLQGRLPIYLFWSPSGSNLAILTQHLSPDGDRLQLTTAKADQPDSEIRLAEGTPLFFTWAGSRVAAFIGEAETGDARLAVMHPQNKGPTTLLPGRPGNFCAPVWAGGKLVYVLQNGARATIVAAGLDDAEPEVIETVSGLVALVRSPDGRRLARAVAPSGDGTPYQDLAFIDLETRAVHVLLKEPCLAFFWLPDGSAIITARVDTERNLMRWHRVGLDGTIDSICDIYPTRDFGFYLRFFEQYAQSHHIIDPTSQSLLIAGGVHGQGDPHQNSALWEVPIGGGTPRELADAVFGVYGPPVRDAENDEP
ncbi:MAG: hypothetical protein AB8H79_21230 [Myxococcota bacterium]